MPLESCTGGHGPSKSSRDPKTVDYSPRKRPEMPEITTFDDAPRVVYRGSRGIKILSGPEPWTYSPRKRPEMPEITSFGEKCPKSRVLTITLESCTGGHGASKSSRDPKTVDYSRRKRPKMAEITSFDDNARVAYRGSRGIEILPGPEPWT